MGSWAAQGKENKEIKGAQDPRMKGYFLSSSPPLVPFDSYNWFTLGGQNQLMESKEEQGEERECMTGIRKACLIFLFFPLNHLPDPSCLVTFRGIMELSSPRVGKAHSVP